MEVYGFGQTTGEQSRMINLGSADGTACGKGAVPMRTPMGRNTGVTDPESAGILRILVVDDYADTARTLASLLTRLGHDARAVTGGADALHLAREFLPEVAVIDLMMPGMDGHAVARGIRETPGLEYALLVAMTGFGPGDKRRAPGGDFDLLLLKPIGAEELLRAVRA
jgi:CheY-like chemotaxis protein